jgi:dolichol-phosphate mannosyltransferase
MNILIIDDGSTDDSMNIIDKSQYVIIKNKVNSGIGVSIRKACNYALNYNYEIIAMMPGNNKNSIAEVYRLVKPIIENNADYVQGSRFLPGSKRDNTPLFRLIMVKVLAMLLSIITGRRITDCLEGFRAFRLSILNDKDINIHQNWLNRYGLEIYLFFKVTYGKKYRYKEVPISKIYPKEKKSIFNKKGEEYTKIKPIIDWWDILRPIPYLLLGIKK